jgi:insertion element IS1 protein InsB
MCKITTIVGCPHCHSAKVVKNGEKNTGVLNFLCRGCGRQFQYVYRYKGRARYQTLDIEHIATELRHWNHLGCAPQQRAERAAEGGGLVHSCSQTVALQIGASGRILELCTPKEKEKTLANLCVCPRNHQVGKHPSRHIESVNTSLRARNRRFVRRTTCFSKKGRYHEAAIKIIIQQRNYAYHTF